MIKKLAKTKSFLKPDENLLILKPEKSNKTVIMIKTYHKEQFLPESTKKFDLKKRI